MAKPLDAFPKNKTMADGLHYYCRQCLKDDYAARRTLIRSRAKRDYYANHAKVRAQKQRRYHETNQKESIRLWRAANKERARATAKRSRANRREHETARGRKWRRANPERRRLYNAQRRAKKNGANGTHTLADWRGTLARFSHKCVYCGSDNQLTQDHIVPLSKGGTHTADNIVPACQRCNSSKGDKMIISPQGQFLLFERPTPAVQARTP